MTAVWWQTLEWQPDSWQQEQFEHFYDLILQGNRQFNLTRIIAPQEFWEKHLWDSLSGIKPWLGGGQGVEDREQTEEIGTQTRQVNLSPLTPLPLSPSLPLSVIDIGTGAGFPGVPVAIVRPNWRVTLLDSTRKKLTFVNQVLLELGIENASTVVDRAERVGHAPHHRERYDLVLIRAVAAASVCAEYAIPLLKVGGTAILYRGQWTDEEAIELQAALEKLGGELEQVEAFLTPLTQGVRHCVYLRKLKPTPDLFPRSIGIPTQKPLK
jgi:16S rRNA (guanine527-N7)-methyltransferase